jgi:hypothetical protein
MNLGTKVMTLLLCDQRRYLYSASYLINILSDHWHLL